jgi:hypothetical protein
MSNVVDANFYRCQQLLAAATLNGTDDRRQATCSVEFDFSTCWPSTNLSEDAKELCPFVFCASCELPFEGESTCVSPCWPDSVIVTSHEHPVVST